MNEKVQVRQPLPEVTLIGIMLLIYSISVESRAASQLIRYRFGMPLAWARSPWINQIFPYLEIAIGLLAIIAGVTLIRRVRWARCIGVVALWCLLGQAMISNLALLMNGPTFPLHHGVTTKVISNVGIQVVWLLINPLPYLIMLIVLESTRTKTLWHQKGETPSRVQKYADSITGHFSLAQPLVVSMIALLLIAGMVSSLFSSFCFFQDHTLAEIQKYFGMHMLIVQAVAIVSMLGIFLASILLLARHKGSEYLIIAFMIINFVTSVYLYWSVNMLSDPKEYWKAISLALAGELASSVPWVVMAGYLLRYGQSKGEAPSIPVQG